MKNETNNVKETAKTPEKNFRAGGISVAVWSNEQKTEYGIQNFRNITLQKRYFDKKTNKWLESNSLNLNEVPKAISLLQMAFDYVITKGKESETDEGFDEDE